MCVIFFSELPAHNNCTDNINNNHNHNVLDDLMCRS